MRTSLSEIKNIEDHLFERMGEEEKLLFDARLILDDSLREKVRWQQKTYGLIQQYGRKKLKSELETIHRKLFRMQEYSGFQQKIFKLFSNKKE